MIFDILVEGVMDDAVARRLLTATGHELGSSFGRRGCNYIRQKINGFAQRARYGCPLLAMVDLMDFEFECPPSLSIALVPERPALLVLSVVVRELESWILADQDGIAEFLRVPRSLVPAAPETLPDPKRTLVNLARRSRRRSIREALVPVPGMSASIGPGYVVELQRFVTSSWQLADARNVSPSLDRCIRRLETMET